MDLVTATTVSTESARPATDGPARWVTPGTLFWAVVLASHLPLLPIHFRRLWVYEHYHYVPFVLAAFGYFVWQRWPTESARQGLPKMVAGVLSASWLLLAIATMAWSPWLAAAATILTIGAVLVQFAAAPGVGRLVPAWLLLWFLIPIPLQLDVRLIFWLQTLASRQASYVLDSLGINHLLVGHTLETPGKQFLVDRDRFPVCVSRFQSAYCD